MALMMNNNLLSQFRELSRVVAQYDTLLRESLGFFETITYKDILFNVSSDFVIADLSPLAFFNLVEYIDADGARAAAVRLYERLLPLLSCSHRWVEAERSLDQGGRSVVYESLERFGQVVVCEFCTACAIQTSRLKPPAVGRSMASIL